MNNGRDIWVSLYYFQLVVVDHDKVVHGLCVVHAYLIALFIIERSFRGYFLIEYIQIFYLSEITFDGLYIFSLLQQTGFKIFQISICQWSRRE